MTDRFSFGLFFLYGFVFTNPMLTAVYDIYLLFTKNYDIMDAINWDLWRC